MRAIRCACLVLVFALLLGLAVSAVDPQQALTEGNDPQEGLSSDVTELIGSFEIAQETDFGGTLGDILSDAASKSGSSLRQALTSAALILAAMLLCGLASSDARSATVANTVGALAISAACAGSLHSMITLASDTLTELHNYALVLLPSLTSLLAACGGVSTATTMYTGSMLLMQLLMTLIVKLLIPMVYLLCALSAVEAALNNGMLAKLRDFFKWLVTTCLKTIVTVFTAYLAVTRILSGSTDAAQLRAAKLTLSGAVPVVGGIVSDASETILSSASVIKSAVGTYGMLAVVGVCALPFLQIAIQYLTLKATTAVGGMLGQKPHVTLVENLSSAMGLLLGMTGAYMLMLLLSVALCIKAVGM